MCSARRKRRQQSSRRRALGLLAGVLLSALVAAPACAPPCSGVSGPCIVLHIEGEGRFDEAGLEWRFLYPPLTPESPGLRAWVEDSVLPGPLTLPADVQVLPPPFLPVNQLGELGLRLRSRTSNLLAAGAIPLSVAAGEHAEATLPLRWYFERRDLPLADPAGGTAQDVIAEDFDGDRRPDLAVLRLGRLHLLYGDGAGGFSAGPLTTGSLGTCVNTPCPQKVRALDLNQDMRPDLVVIERSAGGGLLTFLNPGSRVAFTQRMPGDMPGEYITLVVGQFDATPAQDLAIFNLAAHKLQLFFGASSTTWGTPGEVDAMRSHVSLEAIDANKDPFTDLLATDCNALDPAVDVFLSIGPGMYGSMPRRTHFTRKEPCFLAVGDWSGTRETQALLGIRDEHALLRVLVNPDGSIAPQESYFLATYAGNFAALRAADVDGDARQDLLVSYGGATMLGILAGGQTGGAGLLSPAANFGLEPEPRTRRGASGAIATADFDGDGRLDIVMATQATDGVVLLLNRTPQGTVPPGTRSE